MKALPSVSVVVRGHHLSALVDTGCSKTIVASWLCVSVKGQCSVIAVDGSKVRCRGEADVPILVDGTMLSIKCVVADRLLAGVNVILGMDAIDALGGVTIKSGKVDFLGVSGAANVEWRGGVAATCAETQMLMSGAPPMTIEDRDFTADFDGATWTVKWIWKDEPPELRNRVSCYNSIGRPDTQEAFNIEILRWISEGWLKEWTGEVKGLIPLMAVVQPTKNKVRPVLDFREINDFVECHTGDEVVACDETLRNWRRLPGVLKLVDLKCAYLQIHVDESLWPYQLVRYRDKVYCLTRLGFGLNCAPRIMMRILREVLAKDDRVKRATDHYLDDVIVREDIASAQDVIDHLKRYGLETKPAESLENGRVLGLQLSRSDGGDIVFKRGNTIPIINSTDTICRRLLFSICGKLIGHYPVCSWLRVACSFLKRVCNGESWNSPIGETAQTMLNDLLRRVEAEDPVRGKWHVPDTQVARVWCDASSLALGVCLEVRGVVVEDAAWLRKTTDCAHINVAELEAVLKGVNLAIKWTVNVLEVMTDSATVFSWVKAVVARDRRVKTTGSAEMLIKRRLAVLMDIISEFGLTLSVTLVRSEDNRADVLTRVKRSWIDLRRKSDEVCAVGVSEMHGKHHFGVDRTLYLARLADSNITRDEVRKCVQACQQCQSIDPSPVRHETGELGVKRNWSRLAIDITHYKRKVYLTMVDCGPSRFAIWREVPTESANNVAAVLEELFRERGPVGELLMDNGASFRSYLLAELCRRWNVKRRFRAAYRPAGNGIVERNHRTIKRMAERSGSSPAEAVFWYNISPKVSTDPQSVPSSSLFSYKWRHPLIEPIIEDEIHPHTDLKVGDSVWVKPGNADCTSRWRRGLVTAVISTNNIEVDGVPRHILDLRRVHREEDEDEDEDEDVEEAREVGNDAGDENASNEDAAEPISLRRSLRERRAPQWLRDFVT